MTTPLPPRAAVLLFVLATALAAAVFWSARPDGRDERFEIDEAEWLTMSIANVLQATEGLSHLDRIPPEPWRTEDANPWRIGIHESTFGYMNPMLGKLVFGGLCLALGHRDFDPAVYPRFAKERPPGTKELAKAAVFPALRPVRLLILAVVSLSAAMLLLVARNLAGWTAGFATYASFLANPNVLDHASRIRTDFFPIVFGLGALCVVLASARSLSGERGGGRLAGAALLLGALAGLSVGSKLNGALLALMVGAWILLAWSTRRGDTSFMRAPLVGWLTAGLACVLLYLLFSPHLWPAPIENFTDLVEKWEGDLEFQKDRYGERLGRADSPGESIALSMRGLTGRFEPLNAVTGLPLGAPLLVMGLVWLVLSLRRSGLAAPVLVYVVVQAAGTALWLPFGRDNFFLGFAPVVALLEGLALGALVHFALSRRSP